MTARTRRLVKIKLAWGIPLLLAVWGTAWVQHSYTLGIGLTVIVVLDRIVSIWSLTARDRRAKGRQ